MPRVNIYNIVTNDEYELPVACDLIGAEAVARWLEIAPNTVSSCVYRDHWSKKHKYKAVIIESFNKKLDVAERRRRQKAREHKYYLNKKRRTNNEQCGSENEGYQCQSCEL